MGEREEGMGEGGERFDINYKLDQGHMYKITINRKQRGKNEVAILL